MGQGLPRRGRDPRPVELLTGSRSRHSGLSWQRAKRTAQSGPRSFHKARPRAAHSQQGGAGCFLGWRGPGPGPGRSEGPSLFQGPARLSHLGPGPKAPSATFPEPATGVQRRWGKGLGEAELSVTHTCTPSSTYTELHAHTEADTLTLYTGRNKHRHYTHSQTHMDPHTWKHVFKHTLTQSNTYMDLYSQTYSHTDVYTHRHPPLIHPAHSPPHSVLLPLLYKPVPGREQVAGAG